MQTWMEREVEVLPSLRGKTTGKGPLPLPKLEKPFSFREVQQAVISVYLELSALCTCPPCFVLFCFFNFLKLIYFNWRLIYNIQYYGGFCHTLTWISHGCTCVPHPKSPSLLPPHLIPSLWVVPVHQLWVPCFMHWTWTELPFFFPIYYTYGNIHVSMLFSQIIPPSPFPTESKSLFFISVSLLLSCT